MGVIFADVEKIECKAPEVGDEDLSDVISGTSTAGEWVNWFWRNFVSEEKRSLYDTLIKPISGDFNLIRANGTAWTDAGKLFWGVSNNLSTNTSELRSECWPDGDASAAFQEHVDWVWTPVLWVLKRGCALMGKGFDKMADISIKLASKCAQLLEKVIRLIGKLAKRVVKTGTFAGWVCTAVEWAASGFEDFPFWDEVKAIIQVINDIRDLHDAITRIVTAAQDFFASFTDVIEVVKKIPEIDSTHDAIDAAEKLKEGTTEMRNAKDDYAAGMDDYNKKLDDLAKSGAGTPANGN